MAPALRAEYRKSVNTTNIKIKLLLYMADNNTIRILIVEDELLIAEDMKMQLEELDYKVIGIASSYEEGLHLAQTHKPDIAMVDVVIDGDKDGIELASELRNQLSMPIIFVTSHADQKTVERAKKLKPNGYLVKPFNSKDLYSAIEIAFVNHANIQEKDEANSFVLKDCIFIKKDYLLVKIKFNELKYVKADGNYVEIFCEGKKFLTRSTLKDFMHKLPNDLFAQVHKSYAVNIEYIDAIEYTSLLIGKEKIPISRTMVTDIKRRLKIDM